MKPTLARTKQNAGNSTHPLLRHRRGYGKMVKVVHLEQSRLKELQKTIL